jgi:uncharacterized protein (TIGR00303 family)
MVSPAPKTMPEWIQPDVEFQTKSPIFLCVLSNTETGKIPGISAAGSSPELTDYTPGGDAELVETNKIITMPEIPETPGGAPTPAILTKAALNLSEIPSLFIASGLRKKPAVPFVDIGGAPGNDIRKQRAVEGVSDIMERASLLGRKISRFSDCVFIGESIAGGTTTAMAVLLALGFPGRVSSSLATNPMGLKSEVVSKALERCNVSFGDLKNDPKRAISELGDPMMPCVLGLIKGLQDTTIVLSGGTQMAAVLALAKTMGLDGNLCIATTKYIAEDKSASFLDTIEELDYPYYVVDPGLERSKIPGLCSFTKGNVKEGVGAGGAILGASLKGIGQQQLVEEADHVLMTVELPG